MHIAVALVRWAAPTPLYPPPQSPYTAGWSSLAALSPGSTNPCGAFAPNSNQAYCWGRQLSPNGQLANFSEPTAVASSATWRQLSSGHYVNSTTGLFDDFTCGGCTWMAEEMARWCCCAVGPLLLYAPAAPGWLASRSAVFAVATASAHAVGCCQPCVLTVTAHQRPWCRYPGGRLSLVLGL